MHILYIYISSHVLTSASFRMWGPHTIIMAAPHRHNEQVPRSMYNFDGTWSVPVAPVLWCQSCHLGIDKAQLPQHSGLLHPQWCQRWNHPLRLGILQLKTVQYIHIYLVMDDCITNDNITCLYTLSLYVICIAALYCIGLRSCILLFGICIWNVDKACLSQSIRTFTLGCSG